MYVEYDMTDANLRAMGAWVFRHSPYYRRSIPRFAVGMLACGAIAGVQVGVVEMILLSLFAVAFGLGVLVVVIPRSVVRTYRAGRAVALSRPILVELSVDGVTQRDATGHTFVRWYALEGGGRTADYVFLLVSPLNAIICPRRAFRSPDDWARFADYAISSYERALGAVGEP
ncbi:MAG: YcxB family protein [Actinomycetota bacterium]|nr:YcxB family protein [Actinomycetota bacterium]